MTPCRRWVHRKEPLRTCHPVSFSPRHVPPLLQMEQTCLSPFFTYLVMVFVYLVHVTHVLRGSQSSKFLVMIYHARAAYTECKYLRNSAVRAQKSPEKAVSAFCHESVHRVISLNEFKACWLSLRPGLDMSFHFRQNFQVTSFLFSKSDTATAWILSFCLANVVSYSQPAI